ncbi:sulfite exporter TauE/SafE family protein [Chloroflexota bacterium]
MDSSLWILSGAAVLIAFTHTVMGPDHYLPFIMLGRANKWSAKKVAIISMLCGIGHVMSSVVLGTIGIAVGTAIRNLEYFESFRGEIASFLLIGFGIAYATWGIRQTIRTRPHSHSHRRLGGARYSHKHAHSEDYSHAHPQEKPTTFWALFIIFVLGPCEPLIPLLMFPAATHGWIGILIVTVLFGMVTIGTMVTITVLGSQGLRLMKANWIERYAHALTGGTIAMSGIAIKAFGL